MAESVNERMGKKRLRRCIGDRGGRLVDEEKGVYRVVMTSIHTTNIVDYTACIPYLNQERVGQNTILV